MELETGAIEDEELAGLVNNLKEAKAKKGVKSVEVAHTLDALASFFLRRGVPEQALSAAEEAQKIYEKELGFNSVEMAESLNTKGAVYSMTGELDLAFDCFQKALNIFSTVDGEYSNSVASSLLRMGVVAKEMEKTNEAVQLLQFSLRTFRLIERSSSLSAAEVLKNLAIIYHTREEFKDMGKAIGHYLQCLNIHQQEHQEDAPNRDHGIVLHNIACVFAGRGDHETALEYFTKAEKLFVSGGFFSPDLVGLYQSLSSSYEASGRPDLAVEVLSKALSISVQIDGEDEEDNPLLKNLMFLIDGTKQKYNL